jgi:hypothetical protein
VESTTAARVLVVADQTAATPKLIEAVRERAAAGPVEFHLLVPNPVLREWHPLHPDRHDLGRAENVLALALPLLDEAAGGHVHGAISIHQDPFDAIEEELQTHKFDEIIISTLPHSVSRWLHLDLPSRVEHLGLPVTTVTAAGRESA